MLSTALDSTTFLALLEKAVTEPGTVSKAYSAFYGYSIGNQLLALAQCLARGITPGPIATFPGWKDKGRYVRKGEKAIQLCMPVTVKRDRESAETGESETVAFTRFIYRNNWFVLSQTDGADVEPVDVPAWDRARALASLNVTEEPFSMLDGNCQGYARERTIAVSPVAEYPHKTTFHEIAHILLGHTTETAAGFADDERTPRNLREVEAEAVAMVCCEALELAGSDESRGYIQHWNASRGSEPISERSAQKIFKAADQILKAGTLIEKENR